MFRWIKEGNYLIDYKDIYIEILYINCKIGSFINNYFIKFFKFSFLKK